MITEGAAAISLETTRRAFRNQSQSKQRSTLVAQLFHQKISAALFHQAGAVLYEIPV